MIEFDKGIELLSRLISKIERLVNKDNCNDIEIIVNNYLKDNHNTKLVLNNIIFFKGDMDLLKLNIVEELNLIWFKDE